MTLALIGAAIVWLVVSPTAALLLGRVLARRNRQVPTTPSAAVTCGEGIPRGRRAHLWLVP